MRYLFYTKDTNLEAGKEFKKIKTIKKQIGPSNFNKIFSRFHLIRNKNTVLDSLKNIEYFFILKSIKILIVYIFLNHIKEH